MEKEIKDVYITKYCLSKGIYKIRCQIQHDGYAIQLHDNGQLSNFFISPREYELNDVDAKRAAEEMRIKRLQSLDKQIKKISALKF